MKKQLFLFYPVMETESYIKYTYCIKDADEPRRLQLDVHNKFWPKNNDFFRWRTWKL